MISNSSFLYLIVLNRETSVLVIHQAVLRSNCVATTFSAGCYFSLCELIGLKYHHFREQYLMLITSEERVGWGGGGGVTGHEFQGLALLGLLYAEGKLGNKRLRHRKVQKRRTASDGTMPVGVRAICPLDQFCLSKAVRRIPAASAMRRHRRCDQWRPARVASPSVFPARPGPARPCPAVPELGTPVGPPDRGASAWAPGPHTPPSAESIGSPARRGTPESRPRMSLPGRFRRGALWVAGQGSPGDDHGGGCGRSQLHGRGAAAAP